MWDISTVFIMITIKHDANGKLIQDCHGKAASNNNKIVFTRILDVNIRKKLVNATVGVWLCMVLEYGQFDS
jgi:hypothetical protein